MLINLAAAVPGRISVLVVDGDVATTGLLTRIGLRHDVATLQEVARMERPHGGSHAALAGRFFDGAHRAPCGASATDPQAGRLAEIFDSLIEQAEITLVNGVLAR
jgi:flagellar biosynthesis protein FlhG